MAYKCLLGIGDNPTIPGTFVDLSSNSADNAICLAPQGAFNWKEGQIARTKIKQGGRHGYTIGAVEFDNATLTINLSIQARSQDALLARIAQINYFLALAQTYSQSDGSDGNPVMLTIQLHATSKPVYIDVVDGVPIGPLTETLSDGYWLNSWLRNAKIELLCRPETRGDRVVLDNRQVNGDFQNTIATTSNAGGVDGVTPGAGWAKNTMAGYYGPNCMVYTGQAGSAGSLALIGDAIVFASDGRVTGTPVYATALLASIGSTAPAYPVAIYVDQYNGSDWTTNSPTLVGSVATGAFGSGWQRYGVAMTLATAYVPVQVRLRVVCDQREMATVQVATDGWAMWNNTSRPPAEFIALSGNILNPSRVYGVQGTEPPLIKLGFTAQSAGYGTQPTWTQLDCAISPAEAGGVLGAMSGAAAARVKPLNMCYAILNGYTNYSGATTTLDASDNLDMRSRVYLVKARVGLTSSGTPPTAMQFYAQVVSPTGAFGSIVPLTSQYLAQSTDIDPSGLFTLGYYELGRYFLVPKTAAVATPDLSASRPLLTGATIRLMTNIPGSPGTYNYYVDHIFYFRTDWAYAYIGVAAGVSPSNQAQFILDSEGGSLRAYRQANFAGFFPNDVQPDVRATPQRLQVGAGYRNDVQLVYLHNTDVDVNISNFYTLSLEYAPKFRGGLRV